MEMASTDLIFSNAPQPREDKKRGNAHTLKAPVIRAGVMTANIHWKIINATGGMVRVQPSGIWVPTPASIKKKQHYSKK